MNPVAAPEDRSTHAGDPLASSLRPRGPVQFDLFQEERPSQTVFTAVGELDLLTAPKLGLELGPVVRRGRRDVVIDLTGVTFMDSAALYVLLNAQRRLVRRGRRLSLICCEGPVRRVIELARLVETLGVVEPETAALS